MVQAATAAPATAHGEEAANPSPVPRSVTLARRGISNADGAIEFTSQLIGDTMTTEVKERTAGVVLRGVGVMLRLYEAKQKYADGENFGFQGGKAVDERSRRLELLEAEVKELRAAQ